jgi:succinate dehydrogenase / fumarate reductase, flavoprotein subunit
MELAARDVTSRAEATEIAEGRGIDGNVLLDMRHLGRDVILKKLPQIHEMALDYLGVDMIDEPVPVRPGMHYQMGGIKTDVEGATRVPGIYAAGEVACVSVHGSVRTHCSIRSSSDGAPGALPRSMPKALRAAAAAKISWKVRRRVSMLS